MNTIYRKISTCLVLAAVLLSSCKKYDDFQQNPNNPSSASPSLLLTAIEISLFNGSPQGPAYASRHLTFYERLDVNVNYGWGTNSFGIYDLLRQVKDLQEKAAATGEQNYLGLAKLFRAMCFVSLTEIFGDIPYSDALKGNEGVQEPKYDTQEQVYAGVLAELEEANTLLDPSKGTLAGDIIYGGRPNQVINWKKLVNAYKLRVLIHLSKKEANATLNIKQQFQNIVSDAAKYPLMESNADNGQIVYNTSALNNAYPTYLSLSMQTSISLEQGLVDTLKAYNDRRLFAFAEPISLQPANQFSSYAGVNAGLSPAQQQVASGTASRIKRRYWESQINEPYIKLGYAEQEFLIAEAIARNWVTGAGTAASHYNNGVTASMAFYNVSGTDAATYLAQPAVAYSATNGLKQIAVQKYISFFMNSDWEAFYEQRRTGIPTLNVGAGTLNGGKIPKRWLYPQNEYSQNAANVKASVQSQYGGTDDTNGVMWLLK